MISHVKEHQRHLVKEKVSSLGRQCASRKKARGSNESGQSQGEKKKAENSSVDQRVGDSAYRENDLGIGGRQGEKKKKNRRITGLSVKNQQRRRI